MKKTDAILIGTISVRPLGFPHPENSYGVPRFILVSHIVTIIKFHPHPSSPSPEGILDSPQQLRQLLQPHRLGQEQVDS